MKKLEFVKHIASQHNITQKEAHKIIEVFTSSVISALREEDKIKLSGLGNFSVSQIAARAGQNPSTGEPIQIKAYKQPRFRAGRKFKEALN